MTRYFSGERFIVEQKDLDRARSCTSEAKALAQIKAITDLDKLFRRGIAFTTVGEYGTDPELWMKKARELGASESDVERFYQELIKAGRQVDPNNKDMLLAALGMLFAGQVQSAIDKSVGISTSDINEVDSVEDEVLDQTEEVSVNEEELKLQGLLEKLKKPVNIDIDINFNSITRNSRDESKLFAELYYNAFKVIRDNNLLSSSGPSRSRNTIALSDGDRSALSKFINYAQRNITIYQLLYDDMILVGHILGKDRDDLSVDSRSELSVGIYSEVNYSPRFEYMDPDNYMYNQLDFYTLAELVDSNGPEYAYECAVSASKNVLSRVVDYEDYANITSDAISNALKEFGLDNQQCYEGLVEEMYMIGFDAWLPATEKGSFITVNAGIGTLLSSIELNLVDNPNEVRGAYRYEHDGDRSPASYEPTESGDPISSRGGRSATLFSGFGTFYQAITNFKYSQNIRLD